MICYLTVFVDVCLSYLFVGNFCSIHRAVCSVVLFGFCSFNYKPKSFITYYLLIVLVIKENSPVTSNGPFRFCSALNDLFGIDLQIHVDIMYGYECRRMYSSSTITIFTNVKQKINKIKDFK